MRASYFRVRFVPDRRRKVLWRTLVQYYFADLIQSDFCVLDLGSGYADFINEVKAQRRIAVDIWEELPRQVAPGVEAHVGPVTDLSFLPDGAVDLAFASNVLEHLSTEDCEATLGQLRRKLSTRGRLAILQPNYRYAYREYFDDYTHIAVYSHISLADRLRTNGFRIVRCVPRFLPLTLASRFPVFPVLVRLYLRSPIKPFAKQMLILAEPTK